MWMLRFIGIANQDSIANVQTKGDNLAHNHP